MVNIITLADSKYLANMRVLLRSAAVNMPDAIIYAYIVNADITGLEADNKNARIIPVKSDYTGHALECFCTNARGELLKKHYNNNDMLIWMDATTIIRKPCHGLVELAEKHDITVRAKAEHGKHWAGLICINNTVGGKLFINRYEEIIAADNSWYSNQDALDRCIMELSGVSLGALPEAYLDFKFNDSIIWTGKGQKVRTDKRWKKEMKKYGIKWECAGAENPVSINSKFAYKSELKYWKKKKGRIVDRSKRMSDLLYEYVDGGFNIVADVGCGPRCGIFQAQTFKKMYAIDPLFDKYKEKGLAEIPEGVETICAYADSFSFENPVDLIVSFNSLDHSGNFEKSVHNIMKNTGLFFLHVHLRTKEQLDEVHSMILTEGMIDNVLSRYMVVKKDVLSKDLLYDGDAPSAYVAMVLNR
jgi:SAM-dependent methyltransferase